MSGDKRYRLRESEWVGLTSSVAGLQRSYDTLSQRVSDLRAETQRKIKAVETRLQSQINAVHAEFDKRVGRVEADVREIKQDKARAAAAAAIWIEGAVKIRDAVAGLPLERIATADLTPLSQPDHALSLARESIATNWPEAALSTAQSAYRELTTLQVKAEARLAEWQVQREAALDALTAVATFCRENASYQLKDEHGAPIGAPFEVDGWVAGTFGKLRAAVDTLLAEIADDRRAPGRARLDAILANDIPELGTTARDLVETAIRRVVAAERRAERMADIAEQLLTQGYGYVEGGFVDNDYQGTYVGILENVAGDRIVVSLVPDEHDPNSVEMLLNSYEDGSSDEIRIQRAEALVEYLNDQGTSVERLPSRDEGTGRRRPEPGLG
ncbi:hypothetical protein GCM10009555_058980 [Acrocarpospora macrocephala]|uniref:Uncharacterized protein n=1 Tax=Acrocarpospora macrocephala TaxID=150177 RepID=A0A5M3WR86_9ACTN|nr:hypothetical protein [Acrocarpospora macrocephala]GES11877.1 hypothetical protein Amac_054740 [Acrocarpospora macrocephala]